MKEYPDPTSRWLDIAEAVIMWAVAVLLIVCVCFSVHFARTLLGGAS